MNQESGSGEKAMDLRSGKGTLIAGALAAVGASVCCVAPLVLLALGISGAWMSTLTALEPLRPVFIGLTLLFLGLSFRKVYTNLQACVPGTPCVEQRKAERQRIVFWVVTVLALILLAVPWVAPLLS